VGDDLHAVACEARRDGAADAARGAGDQGDARLVDVVGWGYGVLSVDRRVGLVRDRWRINANTFMLTTLS
jgi:hypothetical protein